MKGYEAIEELKLKLTDSFLETLVEAAKVIGWSVDYCEIKSFINEVYSVVDKGVPNNLDPFSDTEEDWYVEH